MRHILSLLIFLCPLFSVYSQSVEWVRQFKGAKEIRSIRETDDNQLQVVTTELVHYTWDEDSTLVHTVDVTSGVLTSTEPIDSARKNYATSNLYTEPYLPLVLTDSLLNGYDITLPSELERSPEPALSVELKERIIIYNQRMLLIYRKEDKKLLFSTTFEHAELYDIEYLMLKQRLFFGKTFEPYVPTNSTLVRIFDRRSSAP